MQLKNTIIYLIGFPGVGKYTIATKINELCDIKLVDNHLINNVVFSLIKNNDRGAPAVWKNIEKIWDVVTDTVLHISHRDDSFVFTNVLFNEEQDHVQYRRVENLAELRNAKFVPVILSCNQDAILNRIVSPKRAERMKLVSIEKLNDLMSEHSILRVNHSNVLNLDNTNLTADEAASIIINYCKNLAEL